MSECQEVITLTLCFASLNVQGACFHVIKSLKNLRLNNTSGGYLCPIYSDISFILGLIFIKLFKVGQSMIDNDMMGFGVPLNLTVRGYSFLPHKVVKLSCVAGDLSMKWKPKRSSYHTASNETEIKSLSIVVHEHEADALGLEFLNMSLLYSPLSSSPRFPRILQRIFYVLYKIFSHIVPLPCTSSSAAEE